MKIFGMVGKAIHSAIAVGMALMLSACYSSDTPVYGEWGAQMDIATRISCLSINEGQLTNTAYTVDEVANPKGNGTYRYTITENITQESDDYVFAPSSEQGLYVVQKMKEDGGAEYGWYNQPNQTFFIEKDVTEVAEALADINNVELLSSSMSGEPRDIRNFLDQMSKYAKSGLVCLRG